MERCSEFATRQSQPGVKRWVAFVIDRSAPARPCPASRSFTPRRREQPAKPGSLDTHGISQVPCHRRGAGHSRGDSPGREPRAMSRRPYAGPKNGGRTGPQSRDRGAGVAGPGRGWIAEKSQNETHKWKQFDANSPQIAVVGQIASEKTPLASRIGAQCRSAAGISRNRGRNCTLDRGWFGGQPRRGSEGRALCGFALFGWP